MSEQRVSTNGTNGAAPPASASREGLARVYVNGTKGTISFSEAYGNAKVEFDAADVPMNADSTKALIAIGIGRAARTGLTADDPVAAVQAIKDAIMGGTWTPPERAARAPKESEPDVLDLALAEHLKKEPAEIEPWLQNYAKAKGFRDRNGNPGVGRARTLLRQHSAVAPIVARILADRARTAAQAARKAPNAEDLFAV